MSWINSPLMKRIRRNTRHELKRAARKTIPHLGVIVRKVDVRRHRYLAEHGLPHSPTLAAVFIGH